MRISKSTAIMSGLGATAIIFMFGGADTTAMQHHHRKSIMAHVHTHGHSPTHVHWDRQGKEKAIHDQWALKEILKEHAGEHEGAADNVIAHMHRSEVEAN